jgi:hypothetical protein
MRTAPKTTTLLVTAWLGLVLAATGCKENPTATAACKSGSTSSDECSKCCNSNGANGHKWINGDCGCLGGGH